MEINCSYFTFIMERQNCHEFTRVLEYRNFLATSNEAVGDTSKISFKFR